MRLIHYSDKPLHRVHSIDQSGEAYRYHRGSKPIGLWVSVEGEDDWRSWCEAESFRDIARQHATEVVLHPRHRVLILPTATAMTLFQHQYGYEDNMLGVWRNARIDWGRVASDHQGIIIAPYQWSHRLEEPCSGWYYSWDCASGCIWNAEAVAELRSIPEREAA